MQIRLGNRQDEGAILHLVEEVMKEFGQTVDVNTTESDLRNIDANYMGRDGIFLVADEEGHVLAVAGARRRDEETLEITRLAVGKKHRGGGIATRMLEIIEKFAGDFEYRRIEMPAERQLGGAAVLERRGFAGLPGAARVLTIQSASTR